MPKTNSTELLGNAIADVAETVVVKWVVIAEVMEESGERFIESYSPGDQAVWDTIGLVEFERIFLQRQVEGPSD